LIEIFTTPDGLTLSYERRGSGPLLVCHPGGPGGSAAEFEDFAGLDDRFELVLFSPRGSHGSDPGDDYALTSYVADLEALRNHLGVEQLDLLGFSHGGIVGIAYAAAFGGRVGRLLLIDTPAVWGEDAENAMRRGIEARRRERWFADAAKALDEEQAGAFSSVDELIANVHRQMPLYFHRWESNEKTGGRLAMTLRARSLSTTSTPSSSRTSSFGATCDRSQRRHSWSLAPTTSSPALSARTPCSGSCRTPGSSRSRKPATTSTSSSPRHSGRR
jgi:pimeloyl-ACP methyl ester carboxylesterase